MAGGFDGRHEAAIREEQARTVQSCGAEVCPRADVVERIQAALQSRRSLEAQAGRLAKGVFEAGSCVHTAEAGEPFAPPQKCDNPNADAAETILDATQQAFNGQPQPAER